MPKNIMPIVPKRAKYIKKGVLHPRTSFRFSITPTSDNFHVIKDEATSGIFICGKDVGEISEKIASLVVENGSWEITSE